MGYASDEDLINYVADIFDHGISSFENELEQSTLDIQRKIKGEWWLSRRDNALFNPALLDETQWVRANVYHSLAYYILPKLANFSENDTFLNMMAFYRDRFQDEFSATMLAGINYDFDEDNTFETSEVENVRSGRLDR
jgi:hypothetical protein